MPVTLNPKLNDSITADYKICWINPISLKKGNCTIFTYGSGKEIALAIFKTMYPGYKIHDIEKLKKIEL